MRLHALVNQRCQRCPVAAQHTHISPASKLERRWTHLTRHAPAWHATAPRQRLLNQAPRSARVLSVRARARARAVNRGPFCPMHYALESVLGYLVWCLRAVSSCLCYSADEACLLRLTRTLTRTVCADARHALPVFFAPIVSDLTLLAPAWHATAKRQRSLHQAPRAALCSTLFKRSTLLVFFAPIVSDSSNGKANAEERE